MIYEPREDSYLLQKYVRKLVDGKVLDVGTGSGIQAMAALEKTEEVIAVDINPEAVEYVKNKNINAIQSDLFENVEGRFDWIIFNPPYLPEDPNEPEDSKLATTGGKEGDELLIRFLKDAKNFLTGEGKILVLISDLTGDPEKLFKGYRYQCLEKEKLFFEELTVYLLEQ
ncbi:MAG: methyltransferase [Nanoarchaeota archaeon]|nr:methyltransferase [Nanoarchaeota archaeon]